MRTYKITIYKPDGVNFYNYDHCLEKSIIWDKDLNRLKFTDEHGKVHFTNMQYIISEE